MKEEWDESRSWQQEQQVAGFPYLFIQSLIMFFANYQRKLLKLRFLENIGDIVRLYPPVN